MDRVFIVDDNPLIVESFEKVLNWKSLSCRITGKFTNGIDLLQTCEELGPPDILITDIRMPGIDGLEIIKEFHRRQYSTDMVILSAYDDFQYARTAIRYGAKGYLLKPIVPEELEEVLIRIQNERETAFSKQKGTIDFRELIRIQKALSPDMLKPGLSQETLHEILCLTDPDFQAYKLCFPVFIAVLECGDESVFPSLFENERGRDSGTSRIFLGDTRILFLFYSHSWESVQTYLKRLRIGLGNKEYSIIQFRGSCEDWAALQAVLGNMDKNLVSLFYEPSSYRIIPFNYQQPVPEWKIRRKTEDLILKLQAAPADKRCNVIRDFTAYLKENLLIRETALRMAGNICHFALVGNPREEDGNPMLNKAAEEIPYIQTISQLEKQMELILTEQVFPKKQNVYDWGFIRKVKEYSESHLCEKISLEEVAGEIGVSRSHFCKKYKDMTGETFWNSLNRQRVEKAKESLFKGATLQETAQNVGYENSGYLIRMFKRYTGHTPKKYLKIHG